MRNFKKPKITILVKKIGIVSLFLFLFTASRQCFAQTTTDIGNMHITSSQTPDRSFGDGGTKIEVNITIDEGGGVKKIQNITVYKDAKNRTRDSLSTTKINKSEMYIEQFHYKYDRWNNGTEVIIEATEVKDGGGLGEETYERFERKADEKYFKKKMGKKTINGKLIEEKFSPTDEYKRDGISFIRERTNINYDPNEIGMILNNLYNFNDCSSSKLIPTIEYSYYFRPNFAMTTIAGYSSGEETRGMRTEKFTMFNMEGGVTCMPFKFADYNNKFSISTFALAGISDEHKTINRVVTTRETSPTGGIVFGTKVVTHSFSHNEFVASLGGAIDWNLTPKFHLSLLEYNYNIVGSTHNKSSFGSGIKYRF